MSRYLDTSIKAQLAQILVQYGRSSRFFGRNLYGHLLAGLIWEKQFEKVLLDHGWEKFENWESSFVNREKWIILICVHGRDQNGRKQTKSGSNVEKILMKEVELGEPSYFFDHVFLGCTRRQCEISKDSVDSHRGMFESRISAGAKEILYRPELQGNLMQKQYLPGPMTWKVTRRNVWKDIANLKRERFNSFSKSQHRAWMTINVEKKMNQKENFLQYTHKLFSNVCIWLELGDLTFFGK